MVVAPGDWEKAAEAGADAPGRHGRRGVHRDAEEDALFAHLYRVCAEAARRGDLRPAETLLRSYRGAAERMRAEKITRLRAGRRKTDAMRSHRERRLALIRNAEKKAVRIARLLGRASGGVEDLPTSDLPTAQTVVHARRRRDPLANMRLTRRQEQAAKEIRMVYESLVRALFVRARNLERPAERRVRPMDPVEYLPERIARLRHERYLPWVETQRHVVARVAAADSPIAVEEISAIGLVISVLIDGMPVGCLETRFGVRHGTLSGAFRESLDAYADVVRRTQAGEASGPAGAAGEKFAGDSLSTGH